MNKLFETVAGILFFAFCLALVFLFTGEPSLWDLMHAAAMAKFK
jgi:hypothetical protein